MALARPVVLGNWKMNGLRADGLALAGALAGARRAASPARWACSRRRRCSPRGAAAGRQRHPGRRPGLPRADVRRLHRLDQRRHAARTPGAAARHRRPFRAAAWAGRDATPWSGPRRRRRSKPGCCRWSVLGETEQEWLDGQTLGAAGEPAARQPARGCRAPTGWWSPTSRSGRSAPAARRASTRSARARPSAAALGEASVEGGARCRCSMAARSRRPMPRDPGAARRRRRAGRWRLPADAAEFWAIYQAGGGA